MAYGYQCFPPPEGARLTVPEVKGDARRMIAYLVRVLYESIRADLADILDGRHGCDPSEASEAYGIEWAAICAGALALGLALPRSPDTSQVVTDALSALI